MGESDRHWEPPLTTRSAGGAVAERSQLSAEEQEVRDGRFSQLRAAMSDAR